MSWAVCHRIFLLTSVVLFGPLHTAGAQGASDATACEEAIATVEGGSGLPGGLLNAIARAESGRYEVATRRTSPWPWAINAAGASFYPSTLQAAVTLVRELRLRGVRSVDVGCMQINLQHHPQAFASLEEAFEPRVNVAYAVRFLLELYGRRGDWPSAVAHYHSADSTRGEIYLRRVGLAWGQSTASSSPPRRGEPVQATDRSARSLTPVAINVRVITPTALTPRTDPVSIRIFMPYRGQRG